jgi:3-hydroxymyristoyl/3-hydroxydecanoyl-(acyl carrier protein) dehydratase
MEIELTNKKSKIFVMSGKAYVNDVLVAEADFMAGVVDRETIKNGNQN